MNKNKSCARCGQEIKTEKDCWTSAFHLPFDTFLKLKDWSENNCLCEECIKIWIDKEKGNIEKK